MSAQQTEVLICGAGPTGLALAIELGSRGVQCIVVERNVRVGNSPRAKTTHTRTREHLRRWGIADKLAALAPFGIDYPANVHFVTRLSGHPLAMIEDAFNCAPQRNDLYAEHAQWVPQYQLEEVLRNHAVSLASVRVLFEHEFLSAKQSETTVRCLVRDHKGDRELEIECSYLVGADGPRSSIRDLIGARMEGRYGLSIGYNIIFRAPGLAGMHRHGPGIMYWQVNPELPSLIGPMDKDDLWYFMPTKVPGLGPLDIASAADFIRRATGIDLPYEVLSADEWAASELIANKYRDGRIFLIGDACHLHPPNGGYGMNMGISDSVDLGWKMTAVLQGWGGDALLDAYEQERRPVHRRVVDAALSNFSTLVPHQTISPALEANDDEGVALREKTGAALAERRLQEFRSLGVMLGYTYDGSPITAHEEGAPQDVDPSMRTYVPSARPGARAPHGWLADGRSLYDVFGNDFTLLAFGEVAAAELERAQADAESVGIPLKIERVNEPRIAALYERDLALIRPDQHVAWRGDTWPGAAILLRASGRIESASQRANASELSAGAR